MLDAAAPGRRLRDLRAAGCSLLFPVSDDAASGRADSGSGRDDASATDAPPAADGGCDKSIDFDPANCGACGHDCRGEPCKNRLCTPLEIAEAFSIGPFAFGPSYLYFVERTPAAPGASISYCARDGCPNRSSLAVWQVLPPAILTNDTHVFWATANGVINKALLFELRDGGTPPPPMEVQSDLTTVTRMVLAGSKLFFAERADAGQIRACSAGDLTSCTDGGSEPFSSNQPMIRDLAVDRAASRLFWITDEGGGTIFSCDVGTPCTPQIVVSGQPTATALAVDDTHVYWTTGAGGAVLRAPKAGLGGPSPETLASGAKTPWAIAVDESHVYFTTLGEGEEVITDGGTALGTGQLLRVPKTGGAAFLLASGIGRPLHVGLDATHVYWTGAATAQGAGSLTRVAK
jgi:hypothetical protein